MRCASPMAMPGATPTPSKTRSPARPSVFIELALDQMSQSCDRRFRIGALGLDLDRAAGSGGEHHQAHDRPPGDRAAVLGNGDLGGESLRQLDEARGGAGVQATLIDDGDATFDARRRRVRQRPIVHAFFSPLSSREATLMYLRPASCPLPTPWDKDSLARTLASLIRSGRLTPAITSTLALSMIEIARLDGVPPNMSVSSTTPSPESTSATRSRISRRRCSMSSSGPMHTAVTQAGD